MKKSEILFLVLFIPLLVSGQQIPSLSQFSLNQYYYNPAASGIRNSLEGALGFRRQWTGLSGSPTSFYLNANMPVYTSRVSSLFSKKYLKGHVQHQQKFVKRNKNSYLLKHAAGLQISSDKYGAFNQTTIQASYTLHIPFETFAISLGVAPGYCNILLNRDQVQLLNNQDATYEAYLSQGASTSFFNLNTGIYIYSNKGYFGYSSDQLLKGKYQFHKNSIASALTVHHFFMAGYEFNLSENITIQPNAFVGVVSGLPLNWTLNTLVNYKESFFGGMGYRKGDAIIFMLGYLYQEKFRLSYSYDLNVSKLSGYNQGTHELMLSVTGLLSQR